MLTKALESHLVSTQHLFNEFQGTRNLLGGCRMILGPSKLQQVSSLTLPLCCRVCISAKHSLRKVDHEFRICSMENPGFSLHLKKFQVNRRQGFRSVQPDSHRDILITMFQRLFHFTSLQHCRLKFKLVFSIRSRPKGSCVLILHSKACHSRSSRVLYPS
jgi:hypothetical protein